MTVGELEDVTAVDVAAFEDLYGCLETHLSDFDCQQIKLHLAWHRLSEQQRCAKVAERWCSEAFATDHENRCFTDIAAVIRSGSTEDKG